MAIDYAAIVRAARAWLSAATGLPDGKVIFENQSGMELTPPYATMKLSGARRVFPQDYRGQEYDGAQPQGSEIESFATGPRLLTLTVSVYTQQTSGNASAVALLSEARDALELESVVSLFDAAGVAISESSEVRDLSALLFTNFQGRAHLELSVSVSALVSERVGFIATVEGSGTVSDESTTTALPIAFSLED